MSTNERIPTLRTCIAHMSPAGIMFPTALGEYFVRQRDTFVSHYYTAWLARKDWYVCHQYLMNKLIYSLKSWITSRIDDNTSLWFRETAVLRRGLAGYFLEDFWFLTEIEEPIRLGFYLYVYHPSGPYGGEDGRSFFRMCLTHILDFIGEYTMVVLLTVLENDELSPHPTVCLVHQDNLLLPKDLQEHSDASAKENPFVHFLLAA